MTPAEAAYVERSLDAGARSLYVVMNRVESLEERCERLDQRVEELLMERAIIEELRREDATRMRELEEQLCEAMR